MKLNKLNILVLVLIIGMFVVTLWLHFQKSQQIISIDIQKAFEAFDMTSELKNRHEQTTRTKSIALDSMRFEIVALIEKDSIVNAQRIMELKTNFFELQRSLEDHQNMGVMEADETIQKRLADYLDNYGQEKDIQFIMITNGDMPVAYVDPSSDATQEFIDYINEKYSGE